FRLKFSVRQLRRLLVPPDRGAQLGTHASDMTPADVSQLKSRVRGQVPIEANGRVTIEAHANAIFGRKPESSCRSALPPLPEEAADLNGLLRNRGARLLWPEASSRRLATPGSIA